jgi:hypothetical protein
MPQMAKFLVPGHSNDPIYVNPADVLSVRSGATGRTIVCLRKGTELVVNLPTNEVIAALVDAMKD